MRVKFFSFTLLILVLVIFAVAAYSVQAASVTISGTLTTSDPLHRRTESDCTALATLHGANAYYKTYTFYVSATANYRFESTRFTGDGQDIFLAIYENTFNPASALDNCVAANDDIILGINRLSRLTTTLQADTLYILVVTTWTNFITGEYDIDIVGAGNICIGRPCSDDEVPPAPVDEAPQQVFFDERINSYDTGNSVVLYGKADSDDNWRLEVYNADETGLLLVVYPETIAAVPECPDSNTLIINDEATGISLWRLPERMVTREGYHVCPFQLNAPSTEAGKTYVIIFDTLYPNTYYESEDEWIGGR